MFKDAWRTYEHLAKFAKGAHPGASSRYLGLIDDLAEEAGEALGHLERAQKYRLDAESVDMLDRMLTDLGPAAVSMFEQTPLPFPTIWVEAHYGNQDIGTLITPNGGASWFQARSFVQWEDGLVPPTDVVEFRGAKAYSAPTISQQLILERFGGEATPDMERRSQVQVRVAARVTAMMKVSTILLRHPGMFEAAEAVEAFSRPERRRAEREGRHLPEIRRISLRLGAFGRGQASALIEDRGSGNAERIQRRAHWVRGHFMRTGAGDVTWRMPHMRGIGPLVSQERHILSVQQDDLPEPI